MDFKSLLNKLDSMEAPAKGVAAPELPKAVQLDEGAQLRVLSGQSTILAESAIMEKAAAKKEVKADEQKKAEGKKKCPPMSHIKKMCQDGKSTAEICKMHPECDQKELKQMVADCKSKLEESIEGDLEEGWDEMEADIKKNAAEKKGTGKFDKKDIKPGVTQYTRKSNTFTDGGDDSDTKAAKKKAKKDESVKEGAKPDFLDMDKDGDKKEPMKKAVADKKGSASDDKSDGKKGMSAKQEKFFGKKAVKESVEGTLTFAKALQIIKESNGTAQIDPLDDNLWSWARRVAASKFNESVKADVYAATTYERMGGTWGIAQINE